MENLGWNPRKESICSIWRLVRIYTCYSLLEVIYMQLCYALFILTQNWKYHYCLWSIMSSSCWLFFFSGCMIKHLCYVLTLPHYPSLFFVGIWRFPQMRGTPKRLGFFGLPSHSNGWWYPGYPYFRKTSIFPLHLHFWSTKMSSNQAIFFEVKMVKWGRPTGSLRRKGESLRHGKQAEPGKSAAGAMLWAEGMDVVWNGDFPIGWTPKKQEGEKRKIANEMVIGVDVRADKLLYKTKDISINI